MKVYITINDASRKVSTFALEGDKQIQIGRSKTANMTVNDALCSGSHCKIYIENDGVYIEDLQSKNGILLNGVRIMKQRIFIHDEIKIGDSYLFIEKSKLNDKTIELLTSKDTTARIEGNLTLELQMHNEKRSQTRSKINTPSKTQKDFVKNSKLYKGVATNKEVLSNPMSKSKLMLLSYLSVIIDLILSILVLFIPSLVVSIFGMDVNELISGGIGILCAFSFFKWNRSRIDGSFGERLLGLD